MNSEYGENDQQGVMHAEENEIRGGEGRLHAPMVGGVIVLATIFAFMPFALERSGIAVFLVLYGVSLVAWLTFALSPRWHERVPSFPLTVVVALLLRAVVLPFDPALSHDVQRYRWDGLVAIHGINPYTHPPDASALAHLRTGWHALINHQEIATIYPPAAQGLFAILGAVGGSLLAWRLLLLAFDLATIRMLRPRQAWLWALCPLVVIEGFWSAHLEIVAAALLLAAARAVSRRAMATGAIAAGLAAGVKLVPLAAFPALASFGSRRFVFIALALVTLIAPALPFLAIGPLMPGLAEYANRWEFNAPLYETVRWVAAASGLDAASKSLFTATKDALGAESIAPFIYARLHPAWMARAVCGLFFLAGLFVAMRLPALESRAAWSVAALLLAAPALHPWYWIALLPLALEARSCLLVALALASPASYLLYSDLPWRTPLVLGATYLLPLVVVILGRRTIVRPEARAAGGCRPVKS